MGYFDSREKLLKFLTDTDFFGLQIPGGGGLFTNTIPPTTILAFVLEQQ